MDKEHAERLAATSEAQAEHEILRAAPASPAREDVVRIVRDEIRQAGPVREGSPAILVTQCWKPPRRYHKIFGQRH